MVPPGHPLYFTPVCEVVTTTPGRPSVPKMARVFRVEKSEERWLELCWHSVDKAKRNALDARASRRSVTSLKRKGAKSRRKSSRRGQISAEQTAREWRYHM